MSHAQSVAVLRGLLDPQNDARPNFLMGAGASFSSGVPLASESVRRLAKQVYSDLVLGRKTLPEHIKTSEWMNWLQGQPWFLHGDDRLAENFPLIIEHSLKPEAYRRRVLMDLVAINGDVGSGYRAYAELVLRGLAGTALTTNFDLGLPKALGDKQPHIRYVAEVNRGQDDFAEFGLYSRAQIVWLHGKAEQYTDRNLIDETRALNANLLEHVKPLVDSAPLVVIGYRGAEASIMHSLLGDESGLKFRNGIYWCVRTGETLHPNVDALARRLGGNFQILEIAGFDGLMGDLNKALAGIQRFADPPSAGAAQFDDQPAADATWADVDADLALSTLKTYCEKLERGELSLGQLRPLMRELGLLLNADGIERPSVGCILLFGRQPERFFPHAIISATLDGKKRQVLHGNLLSQQSQALEWLEQADVNPSIKVKGLRKHETRKAYSERALVELLVNMIVHRDYEAKAAATIEVVPNTAVRFVNPSTQGAAAKAQLKMDADGVFTPVPEFSDLRNRALCDIFFGISAMERAGTGLTDAGELSRKQGGGASFAYPPGRDQFVAELFRPEASAGSTSIAKDTRPVGTYFINMLPFAAMPQTVTWLKVKAASWSELEERVPMHEAGVLLFEKYAGIVWSFAPAALLSSIFSPVLLASAEEIAISDMEKDPDLRRKLSWLLRRHFEAKLKTFETDGLVLERAKKRPAKRAYFQSLNLRNRPIVYDTPAKRNVKRDVVKRRGDDANTWFECEGFGYEIITLGGVWGVRIKPFYMFAGRDGVSPLPNYMRASKSTKRIRFDRNANVESDLVFWGRYLSGGEQTINIGDQHTADLLLEGSFYSVDVQEGGLVDVPLAQNKRTA